MKKIQFNFIVLVLISLLISANMYAQADKVFNTVMRTFAKRTMCDGYEAPMWGFAINPISDITFPATTLIMTEGDSVHLKALNFSQDHHTVHLHGLDADMLNDGDPMTSFELDHQERFTYKFKATHAGTYIYHCHTADVVHVQMGMYGMLIVKPKDIMTPFTGGPSFKSEYAFLMSELDSVWHNKPPKHDPEEMTVMIPTYQPSYFLVNGKCKQQITDTIQGNVGDNIYLRFANIGFMDNQIIFPSELNAHVLDSDGRPYAKARRSDTLYVSPGERFGVMVNSSLSKTGKIQVAYINLNNYKTEGTEFLNFAINQIVANEKASMFQADLLKVFPNPSNHYLRLELKNGFQEKIMWKIESLDGKVSMEGIEDQKDNFEINISGLPKGLYVLQVKNKEFVSSKKIVITN
jgi:FtsP/CotA-like multicopper oxidase with cupredoxin domain